MSLDKLEIKSLKEIYQRISNAQVSIQLGSKTYENDKRYFDEMMKERWVSVESLKDFLIEKLLNSKLDFEQQTKDCFEDFDWTEFLSTTDNRDDVWYIGQLYAEIKLLQKLLGLLEKEKLNELVEKE